MTTDAQRIAVGSLARAPWGRLVDRRNPELPVSLQASLQVERICQFVAVNLGLSGVFTYYKIALRSHVLFLYVPWPMAS